MRSIFLFVVSFFISFASLVAQDFSNKGRDFWVGYGNHVRMFNNQGNGTVPEQMQIYITSDVNTTGTVEINSIGFNQPFTVIANQIAVVDIPRSAALLDEGLYNHGIHIKAVQPVVAYGFIYVNAVSGATVFLPTNTLGKNYYSVNFAQSSNEPNSFSYFFVCATDTGTTTVEITPSQFTRGGMSPGSPVNITLTQGQIYQVLSQSDLTGSTIRSVAGSNGSACKRISVFCGSGKLSIGCTGNPGSSDNLYQQMYPASAWGKKYVLVPSINTPGVQNSSVGNLNYFRIFRPDPSTNVFLNGALLDPTVFTGDYYQFSSNLPGLVDADKPVMVAQYFTTAGCSGNQNPHDPDMIYLNPVEQTVSNVTVNSMQPASGTAITRHFINVVLRNAGTGVSSFTIDGAAPTGTPEVLAQDNNFAFMRFQVSAGAHNLSCDSGFNAIAYGFGSAESYGYSAGTNLRDLYNFIAPLNPLNISGQNTVCACTPFYLTITYPFQPTSLYFDFQGFQTPNVTLNNPVADTTYQINGKQVWRYKLPNPYTYCPARNYPITVTAGTAGTDGCGNTQVKEDTLYVKNTPVPEFTFTSNGCVTDSVYFRDETQYETGVYAYIWNWDFGDGQTSNLPNPAHKYATPGTYTVKLSVVTNVGCISTQGISTVTVGNKPVAHFGFPATSCSGQSVHFSDSSTVAAPDIINTWRWNYGDGNSEVLSSNTNVNHTYQNWGAYHVQLQVASPGGCLSNLKDTVISVSPLPLAAFDIPAVVCLPYQAALFTNQSSIADGSQASFTYQWTFGEPATGNLDTAITSNGSHLYGTAGSYPVRLTVRSNAGCIDDTVRVFSNLYVKPVAAITVNAENCLNTVTGFTSGSTAPGSSVSQWYWNYGNGTPTVSQQNPTYTYPVADTFQIQHWIQSAVGCYSDTATQSIIINPLPHTGFRVSSPVCETDAVVFTDTSAALAGSLITWTWNFGNGRPDSILNSVAPVSLVYPQAGTYTVSLRVETDKGCKTAVPFNRTVVVNPKPVAGYISPEVCLTDASAQFIDTSSVRGSTITNWSWNFGDPSSGAANTSSLQNPPHRYNAIGLYTASLTVTTANGCSATASQQFTVNGDIPVARAFAMKPAYCSTDSVYLRDSSTVNFGNITKVIITWDVTGAPSVTETDDFPYNGKVYSHRYPEFQQPLSKIYQVRYQAFSGGSCSDDVLLNYTVNADPATRFTTVPPVCLDAAPYQLTQAADTGNVPGTGIYYGTGVNNGFFNPAGMAPGVYPLKYVYTSVSGCKDSTTGSIRILVPPVAKMGVSTPVCVNTPVVFTDSSTSSAGTLVSWIWNPADGTGAVTRSTNAAFSYSYSVAGSYQPTLTVVTNDGCRVTSSSVNLQVKPLPVASFDYPQHICMPAPKVVFTDRSSIPDGTENSFTYLWDFGDPASGTANRSVARNPEHTYPALGPYSVRLTVTSGSGCKDDTVILVNRIRPEPTAAFNSDSVSLCANQRVQFTDVSNPAGAPITRWAWNFGDGQQYSGGQTPPAHTYTTAGVYPVTLQIENAFGCTNTSAIRNFKVYPYPVIYAGPDTVLLEGGEIRLSATATGNGLQYLWQPPSFLSDIHLLNPVVRGLNDDITYTLRVVAEGGCTKRDDVFIKLLRSPVIPNTFTPNGDQINDTWVIQYLESYPDCRIQVFTRDGLAVYETKGYIPPGWDGTFKGKALPFGTYYYVIEPGSGRKPITGYVTLIK